MRVNGVEPESLLQRLAPKGYDVVYLGWSDEDNCLMISLREVKEDEDYR